MLIPLLQNVSMLLAIVVIYTLVAGRRGGRLLAPEPQDVGVQIQSGLMVGLIAIVMILTPVRYAGLLLDARTILLSLAALFLGSIPTFVALVIAAIYRVYTGGPGLLPAMIVMSTAVIIGLLWRRLRKPKLDQIGLAELYLFGLTVHGAIIALAFLAPKSLPLHALTGIAFPVLLVEPLAVLAIGGLLVRQLRQETLTRAIKVSEERYRLLAENVTDIIVHHDADWRVVYVSPSVRQLGYEPEALLGARPGLTHPEDAERIQQRLGEVRRGLTCGAFETRVRTADGDWVWIESKPSAIRDDQGQIVGVLSVWRDVSARKAAETALREVRGEMARVARISALGAFSASLAHEINQPLAALTMNSEVVQRLLSIDPPDLAKVEAVVARSGRDARRASEIIARMRALITRQTTTTADFDVGEAIGEALELTHGELQRWSVTVEATLARGACGFHGDRIQIQQVALNLIQNAIEAMRETPEGERRLLVRCGDGDGRILVEIEDRGPGLDPGTADNIFEHLFTTKEGGTGLGLAISKSIIEAHGGRIWAAPAEPRGAVFRFWLPQANGG